MSALHLVTGYKGSPHVTSADQGSFNAGCIGLRDYVLGTGRRFETEVVTSNAVRIFDGDLVIQGRHVRLEPGAFLDCIITNGATGYVRNDLVVVRYEKDSSTGIESVSFAVKQGVAVESSPADPAYTTGDVLSGTTTHEMPLYRVKLSGVAIQEVEPLFTTVAPMEEMQKGYYNRNLIINSDFRCNQRGQTSWDVSTTATYTVDMWRAFQVKVQTAANGIKVAGRSSTVQGYFTQFVDVGSLAEKYTICVRANGVVYSFTTALTGTAVEKVFDNFKITALYLSSTKRIKINYCPLTTGFVTIGYIDLYEGTYAYPHVKEDYSVALMRCRGYVRMEQKVCPIVYSYTSGTDKGYMVAINHGTMIDTPTVTVPYWQYQKANGDWQVGGNDLSGSPSTNGAITHARLPYRSEKHTDCYGITVTYLATCEPNDA